MMMHLLKIVVAIGQISLSSAAWRAPTDPLSLVNPLPASLENIVQGVKRDRMARGYEFARGYWTLWSVEDCKYPIRTLGIGYRIVYQPTPERRHQGLAHHGG